MSELLPVYISRHCAPNELFGGIVLDLDAERVLLAGLRDGGYFDGYTIFRLADIRAVRASKTFIPFLHSHQPWPPARPPEPIDLAGPASFLADISQTAAVIGLHTEVRRPNMLWIGTPVEWGKKSAWFHTIDPRAQWDDLLIKVKFKHLTRVDFSDDYINVVFELAGHAPAKSTPGCENTASAILDESMPHGTFPT
ncbi:hypothetical protein ACFY5D_04440 [Paeniglutamicibacter sp. NPDC012692]|uniref:hypothetical protein n=1 Tax=Paeniglutamicibacter sp. NPDC012692 TaxID=3364388 RepID=UPI003681772D